MESISWMDIDKYGLNQQKRQSTTLIQKN